MDGVDASSHEQVAHATEPPALLTIILDTNPHAWGLLSTTLPLSTLIANLLVFINAHLAINNTNEVAVIASHIESARFLYPTTHDDLPLPPDATTHPDLPLPPDATTHPDLPLPPDATTNPHDIQNDANKYRPFAQLEKALTNNLRALFATTTPNLLKASTSTMLSGALTLALTYIAKATLQTPGTVPETTYTAQDRHNPPKPNTTGLQSRVLILSVSGDIADQYIPIMNTIFACQRLTIPIDVLTLSAHSNAEFLQQAADATGGVYMALGTRVAGLLQVLMMAYLPDATARTSLVTAGEAEGVDFRAACFCHRNIVDLGYVCSICLSIFCQPPPENTCLTCGTPLSLAAHPAKPIVIPRNKKKKKRKLDPAATPADSPTTSAAGTPR